MQYINAHMGTMWRNLPQKRERVYSPMVDAFIDEIRRQNLAHENIPQLLVEYLIGQIMIFIK